MRKKLTRIGNIVALVLDRDLLTSTGLDAGATVEVSTDGEVIIISPVRERARTGRLKRVMGRAHERYAGVFAFLGLNGLWLEAEEDELVETVLALARGDLTKAGIAEYLRTRVVRLGGAP